MRYFTNSEVTDWDTCKRKWWIRYYLELGPEEQSKGVAYQGNLVHDALDAYYGEGLDEEVVLAGLRRRLDRAVEAQDVAEAKAVESALAMVEGYFEWLADTGEDQDWEVLGSEEALTAPISEDATALAKLDLRLRSRETGFVGLLDHKTTGDLVELETGAHFRPQFLHYLHVASSAVGERIDGLVVNGLKRSKRTARATPPFFVRFTVRHNRLSVASYAEQLRSKVAEMLKARRRLDDGVSHHTAVPPSKRPECARTCEFARVCPLLDELRDPGDIFEPSFTRMDPFNRYKGLLP